MNKYQTMFVNLDKVQAARNLSALTSVKTLLLVCWSDVMGYIDFNSDFDVQ